MEASSQVDENSDLKNADIIRIQGFTQSLMHRILKMNKHLRGLQEQMETFESKAKKLPDRSPAGDHGDHGSSVAVTPATINWFNELRDLFLALVGQFEERAGLIGLLENRHVGF